MARKKMTKKKTRNSDALSIVSEMFDVADTVLERLTGKTIPGWLKDFKEQDQSQPKVLQSGSPRDPYDVLGLPPTASLDQVKKRYRQLAGIYHPDREDGYDQAMKVINEAYGRITKGNDSKV